MERTIHPFVLKDLERKMVLIGGPRQVGKTTLSRCLFPENSEYLTYDNGDDREIIRKKNWSRKRDLIIFDELHKMKAWKTWLKGVYDKEGNRPRILVTGSARLDTYRKGSDSMAGRFFYFRLHPISLAELKKSNELDHLNFSMEKLLTLGGFPEPFYENSEEYAKRWRRTHLDRILKEDLLDLEQIRELGSIEILVDLLADRVGSTLSAASLARDLQVAPRTVQRWIEILERLMVIFVVTPFSKNVTSAIKKEPKIYFYDTGRVKNDPGARFENLVACSLLKRLHFLEDTQGEKCELHYVRDKQKREVDFLTIRDRKQEWLIEVKLSDTSLSTSLLKFSEYFKNAQLIQLVKNISHTHQRGSVLMAQGSEWLSQLET